MRASQLDPLAQLPLTPIALEILLALGDGERHGYDIMLAIEARTEGRVSPNPGTLYRAVDRLLRNGVIEIAEHGTTHHRWRRRYRLSSFGARVAAAEVERLSNQVNAARGTRLIKRFAQP